MGTGQADKESVLIVHNRYRERGGEDVVFDSEAMLLKQRGHRVRRFSVDNALLPVSPTPSQQVGLAVNTLWSRESAAELRKTIRDFGPDVVQVHNTFPQLSPSIYEACAAEGVRVFQTLHNYRFVCPAATLFRDGRPCEDCVGRAFPWPGVMHACYQGSRARSAVVASMLGLARARGALDHVSAFIALNEFGRRMFVRGGLPDGRVVVKPNFVDDIAATPTTARSGFLFVGRLAPEKGVGTMLRAWRSLPDTIGLRIIGDGPLRGAVQREASTSRNILYDGPRDHDDVLGAMASARALVFPSEWYEGCPMTIIESFASRLPVVASRLGSLEEMVLDGHRGLLFERGAADDLAEKIRWLHEHGDEASKLGDAARDEYLREYTADRSYARLMAIYRRQVH